MNLVVPAASPIKFTSCSLTTRGQALIRFLGPCACLRSSGSLETLAGRAGADQSGESERGTRGLEELDPLGPGRLRGVLIRGMVWPTFPVRK